MINLFARSLYSSFRRPVHAIPRQLTCIRPDSFRMASTLPRLPIFEALHKHDAHSTAVVHYPSGRHFTYGELVHDVADSANELRAKVQGKSLSGERVAFLVENGYDYVGAEGWLIFTEHIVY